MRYVISQIIWETMTDHESPGITEGFREPNFVALLPPPPPPVNSTPEGMHRIVSI